MKFLHLLLSVLLFTNIHCQNDDTIEEEEEMEQPDHVKEAEARGEKVMSFSQPTLTEEEQNSYHFPDRYRCEACQIVIYNLGTIFQKAEAKIPKKKQKKTLSEVDIIDLVENLCDKSGFDDYSIQEFSGTVTFKGPAFPDRNAAGMSMGGGLWPSRYVNYCGSLMEDLYEDEVYSIYRKGNLFKELCMSKHCSHMKHVPSPVDFKPSNKDRKANAKQEL